MAGVSLALPQAGQAVPAPTPLGTISYNIPGVINSTLTPILGKGSDGGLEVGGIGSHDTPGGVVHEHGTGDAQIGPEGVEVCLTQTFVVGVSLLIVVVTVFVKLILTLDNSRLQFLIA